jgi:large subunit ribosomal protein L24
MPSHIRKGDMVMVTAGNERGVTGEVLRVLPKEGRVVVQGVNVRTRHLKPRQDRPQGGLLRVEMPIHQSNVSPVVDGKPTRVRFQVKADGTKVRIAVRTGAELHTLRGERAAPRAPAAVTPPPSTRRTIDAHAKGPAKAQSKGQRKVQTSTGPRAHSRGR